MIQQSPYFSHRHLSLSSCIEYLVNLFWNSAGFLRYKLFIKFSKTLNFRPLIIFKISSLSNMYEEILTCCSYQERLRMTLCLSIILCGNTSSTLFPRLPVMLLQSATWLSEYWPCEFFRLVENKVIRKMGEIGRTRKGHSMLSSSYLMIKVDTIFWVLVV